MNVPGQSAFHYSSFNSHTQVRETWIWGAVNLSKHAYVRGAVMLRAQLKREPTVQEKLDKERELEENKGLDRITIEEVRDAYNSGDLVRLFVLIPVGW